MENIKLAFGGDALNEAAVLTPLGKKVDLISKVGDDETGFLWALSEGMPLMECGCFACAVESCTVECMGSTDGAISFETSLSRFREIKKAARDLSKEM